jgi:hypothetical protein
MARSRALSGRGARGLAVERGELGQKEGDKMRGGAAPVSPDTRVSVAGEVTDAGVLGRLGARTPNPRPPGARLWSASQGTVGRGQTDQDKAWRKFGFDQIPSGEASGEAIRSKELV